MKTTVLASVAAGAFSLCACTIHHSKQALSTGGSAPPADASFVTEEDSGLMLAGILVLTEPDHYAVLLERARRRYRCARMHHAQLDFFTDYWIIVAFPIARVTLVCEREGETASKPAESAPAERAGEP
ncbi:MAG TPA: hypothetical protein VF989_02195 [Polyangiaceae bacterium]|jgi:hypothetical protein